MPCFEPRRGAGVRALPSDHSLAPPSVNFTDVSVSLLLARKVPARRSCPKIVRRLGPDRARRGQGLAARGITGGYGGPSLKRDVPVDFDICCVAEIVALSDERAYQPPGRQITGSAWTMPERRFGSET